MARRYDKANRERITLRLLDDAVRRGWADEALGAENRDLAKAIADGEAEVRINGHLLDRSPLAETVRRRLRRARAQQGKSRPRGRPPKKPDK